VGSSPREFPFCYENDHQMPYRKASLASCVIGVE
jgi:hypothetical protein